MEDHYRIEPFEHGDRRLMVSLGPLTAKRYCTYSCPFCYVNAGYESFSSLTIQEIFDWVDAQNPATFDTIYVSGDTDSFAAPRQEKGLELLEKLAGVNKDLLFTTRALFNEEGLSRLQRLNESLRANDRWMFGCVSICQWTVPHLEPRPISRPELRASQVVEFHKRGLVSVLGLRPFLPNVPLTDYTEILDRCGQDVDLVLGEHWYADVEGRLEQATLYGASDTAFNVGNMPFDSNVSAWKVFELEGHERYVQAECSARRLPFFMRSMPALEYWRSANKSDV